MVRKLGVALSLVCSGALLCACSADDGAPGAQGPTGQPGQDGMDGQDATGNPSISAVIPNQAFLARTLDVTIAGYGTEWNDSTAVDFGSAITVNDVVAASPTALIANISVSDSAEIGVRDVVVSGAADPVTYAGAFRVDAPIEPFLMTGTPAEGSLVLADVRNIDLATPFDTTAEGDGIFTPLTFPNINVTFPAGISAKVDNASLYSLQLLLLVDVGVAGAQAVDIESGPPSNVDHFLHPSAFDIAARTPTTLTLGQDANGSVPTEYASELYRFETGAGAKIIDLALTSASGHPHFVVLPASGSFQDMMVFDGGVLVDTARIFSSAASETYYLVAWDDMGTAGYDFTISSTTTDLADSVAESEPNDDPQHAQVAAGVPLYFGPAQLSSLTDEDWIELTFGAGHVGSQVHVVTMPGDASCDTVVEVLQGDGTTSLGGESLNYNYHEDHFSTPIPAAGTYYVKISADQTGWYNPSYPNYGALITVE